MEEAEEKYNSLSIFIEYYGVEVVVNAVCSFCNNFTSAISTEKYIFMAIFKKGGGG